MAYMIDLRRLHVLRAVAYHGTVTAAARSLHLTPSAASQQIRQLGRDLGVVLLERHGRRVRLTPTARTLLSHADAIESRWQRAEAELLHTGAEPAGVLRMAGFPTAVSTLLAPVTAILRDTCPALTVRLREAEPAESFDLLFAGDTDLAVVEATQTGPAVGDRRFDQRSLLDDRYDLLVHREHRFAGRNSVDLAELSEEDWIIGVPDNTCREHTLAACTAAGFSPNIAHEAEQWDVVATLVAHRLGVALTPRLRQLPPDLPVAHLPVTGPTVPSRKFLTCTRRGGRELPAVAAALRELEAYALSRQRSG
ncbi:DNA-binding transcriptional LysR family regulator [Amycolatopsis cihanbeyliensis]|uniref:DNA-binding transcriptional LysR family regulator n=2 Tax=Amycolatopsis cihanbeyliensis TaxID=1128664 RepID=A0A542DKQ6_AMYCI|nr:DNA-binding transcriptional LysR family regulator [Amycolatopsis cihanbeyliensis]